MWVTTAEFPGVQGLRGHQHSLPALGISGQIFGTKTHPGGGTKSCTALYKDGPSISLFISFIFVAAASKSREQVAVCREGNGQWMSETNGPSRG